MIRRWGSVVACVVFLALAMPGVAAAGPDQERILSFVTSADVRTNGAVVVTERIRYHFGNRRHGIFRSVPLYYPLVDSGGTVDEHQERKLTVDDYSATMDGHGVPFVRDTEATGADENFVLRIGDEHREITGDHDYRLQYRIQGLLSAPDGRAELRWDALGDQSNVLVEHAVVTVTAPGPLGRVRYMVGGNERGVARVDGDSARFVADEVGANTAVTVAAELPAAVTVPPPTVRAKPTFSGRVWDNLRHPGREAGIPTLAVVITIAEFTLCAVALCLLYFRSRDRYFTSVAPGCLPDRVSGAPEKRRLLTPRPAVRPEPPSGVPAALCGVILRRRVDRATTAAVLVDMAVRGILTITEVPGGFRVARPAPQRLARKSVHAYERPIVAALGDGVTLTGRRDDSPAFGRALAALPRRLIRETLRRGWLTAWPHNPAGVRAAGVGILILSVLPLLVLASFGLAWLWMPLAVGALVLAIWPDLLLPGRTALGSAARSQVLGFRQFLQTADPRRFDGDNLHMTLNRYLPYALALGLADHWVTKFAAAGITPDAWVAGQPNLAVTDILTFTTIVTSSARSPDTASASSDSYSGNLSGAGGSGGVGSW